MRVIFGAGVDDGQRFGADEIGVRAVESEGAGVVDGQPGHALGHRNGGSVGRVEGGLELDGHCKNVLDERPVEGRKRLPHIMEANIPKPG